MRYKTASTTKDTKNTKGILFGFSGQSFVVFVFSVVKGGDA